VRVVCYKNKSNFQWAKKGQGSKEGKPFEFFFGKRISQEILFRASFLVVAWLPRDAFANDDLPNIGQDHACGIDLVRVRFKVVCFCEDLQASTRSGRGGKAMWFLLNAIAGGIGADGLRIP
jgi:hypothetical protein